jgi:hypothetical protein
MPVDDGQDHYPLFPRTITTALLIVVFPDKIFRYFQRSTAPTAPPPLPTRRIEAAGMGKAGEGHAQGGVLLVSKGIGHRSQAVHLPDQFLNSGASR